MIDPLRSSRQLRVRNSQFQPCKTTGILLSSTSSVQARQSMSRKRQHRKPPVGAITPAPPSGTGAGLSVGLFSRHVLFQLAAILGLSCVLGFTFNAASPVGIRFGEPAARPIPVKATVAGKPGAGGSLSAIPVSPPLPPAAPVAVATSAIQPALLPPWSPVVASPPPLPVDNPHPVTNPTTVNVPPRSGPPNPAPIHWPEAKLLVAASRAVLVDVRHKSMYDAGHIPGAISLPESSPPQEFVTFLNQQPAGIMIIVYCSSTSCSQSARVANRFVHEFHWPSVRYMTGGYLEYQQSELAKPTSASPP